MDTNDELQRILDAAYTKQHSTDAVSQGLLKDFAVGSSFESLSPKRQRAHELLMRKWDEHSENVSPNRVASDLFYQHLAAADGPPDDPCLLGVCQSASEDEVTSRDQRSCFAYFGVAPPHELPNVDLDAVEESCDFIYDAGCGSALAFLFERSILDLALAPEVVSRVRSILGDNVTLTASSGPMYLPPKSVTATEWHFARGNKFGGGQHEGLDLVTAWVALTDATEENGCMRIAPRSWPLHRAWETCLAQMRPGNQSEMSEFVQQMRALIVHLEQNGIETDSHEQEAVKLLSMIMRFDARFDRDTVSRVLTRTLNDTPDLITEGSASGGLYWKEGDHARLSPFHFVVNILFLLSTAPAPDQLRKSVGFGARSLEVSRGSLIMFSSENLHASFANNSDRWRKALSFRFVKTGLALENLADRSTALLDTYIEKFPNVERLLEEIDKPASIFQNGTPRICVSGDIPESQRDFYVDPESLRTALSRWGGSALKG